LKQTQCLLDTKDSKKLLKLLSVWFFCFLRLKKGKQLGDVSVLLSVK